MLLASGAAFIFKGNKDCTAFRVVVCEGAGTSLAVATLQQPAAICSCCRLRAQPYTFVNSTNACVACFSAPPVKRIRAGVHKKWTVGAFIPPQL